MEEKGNGVGFILFNFDIIGLRILKYQQEEHIERDKLTLEKTDTANIQKMQEKTTSQEG